MLIQQTANLANPENWATASAWAGLKTMWLQGVTRDKHLPKMAYRVAMELFDYFNHKNGRAWPKQATLAAQLGVDRKEVRRGLKALEAGGHIILLAPATPNSSAIYTMAQTARPRAEQGQGTAPAEEADQPLTRGQSCPSRGGQTAPSRGGNVPPEPRNRTHEGTKERTKEGTPSVPSGDNEVDERRQSPSLSPEARDLLDRLREVHPRKRVTKRSEQAAVAALHTTNAETILEGARRYERKVADGKMPEWRPAPLHLSAWLEMQGWAYPDGDPQRTSDEDERHEQERRKRREPEFLIRGGALL